MSVHHQSDLLRSGQHHHARFAENFGRGLFGQDRARFCHHPRLDLIPVDQINGYTFIQNNRDGAGSVPAG